MIAHDSILRRLPADMSPRQALFFDGIRHAGEIASLAHRRLTQTLTLIATTDPQGEEASLLYTSAFLDAWSLVDVFDRFRSLWASLPNVTHPSPPTGTKSFAELSQSVRNLRNVADHLAQKADYVVSREGTALGVLNWFTALQPDGMKGVICTIVPGRMQNRSTRMLNPAGQKIDLPTGLIHLAAGEYEANLSEVIPEMALRIKKLEVGLTRAIADAGTEGKHAGADLRLRVEVEFHEKDGSAIPTAEGG